MASTATQRPRLSAEERRAAIIDAAVRLFSQRGFRGTTTRDLASAVGVTEPILYQHFATKRDLYRAIIESSCRAERPSYAGSDPALEAASRAEDDHAFFTRLGELLLEWYEREPHVVRLLLFSALEGHEMSDLFFERQIVVYYEMLTGYIKRRMNKRAFRRMEPVMAARAFTGMITHYGLVQTVFGGPRVGPVLSRKQVVENFARIFLDGMRNLRSNP